MARWIRMIVMTLVVSLAVVACGGDDEPAAGGDGESTAVADDPSDSGAAVSGLEVPANYPLPVPDGGNVTRSLVDDASGTSNVAIAYPAGSFDALVSTYDEFFAATSGETEKVGPSDGLVSWQNEDLGFSVVINEQDLGPVVTLQTGV